MMDLLSQMKVDKELSDYIKQILVAFTGSHERAQFINQDKLVEPLTVRELHILELLEERLTNKEIASLLAISPGTVKGHTINIYQKLEVNGRRQAVKRAIDLGILSPIQ